MYCLITKRKVKRKPVGSGVYRNACWEPCYAGSKAYRVTVDEIPREPKYQFRIVLAESYRTGDKLKKRQYPIATLSYWDIVEDFLDTLKREWAWQKDIWGRHEGKIIDGIRNHFPDAGQAEYDIWVRLVLKKFNIVKAGVIEDYKKSEEYPLLQAKLRKENHQRPENNHKTRTDDQQQKQREQYDRVFRELVSFRSISNKTMAAEIVNAGYRKMAQTYHPDSGGSVEEMQELNAVKKEMLMQLGSGK